MITSPVANFGHRPLGFHKNHSNHFLNQAIYLRLCICLHYSLNRVGVRTRSNTNQLFICKGLHWNLRNRLLLWWEFQVGMIVKSRFPCLRQINFLFVANVVFQFYHFFFLTYQSNHFCKTYKKQNVTKNPPNIGNLLGLHAIISILPYPFVLDFWKINLEKSSSTNWIFRLFQTEFLLPGLPAKINLEIDFCRLKIQFVELDVSSLTFQKSSTDG